MSSRMLRIAATLLLFAVFLAGSPRSEAAAMTCVSIFEGPKDYITYMSELLSPENEEPLAEVISQPVPLVQFQSGLKITRSNAAWTVPPALRNVMPEPWSSKFYNSSVIHQEQFLRKLIANYGGTFSEKTLDDVLKSDRSLELENTTYGEIRSRSATIGTWRWFDANPVASPSASRKMLPYVRMNAHLGVGDLAVTRKLDEFMDQGFGVVEIGNFSVNSSDARVRERTAHLIEMDWLRMAANDDVFVAHVLSPAHARLYKKYGFEIAEEFSVPGKAQKEAILWVRGWQFKRALRRHLGVHLFQANRLRKPKTTLLPSERP